MTRSFTHDSHLSDFASLSPVSVGGSLFRNRLVVAPLTNEQSNDDGTLSDTEYRWLEMRAQGGFGSIITAAAHVDANAQIYPGQLGIFDDAQIPGLRRLANMGTTLDTAVLVQLVHGGIRSNSDLTGTAPKAPSDTRLGRQSPDAKAMTDDEVEDTIEKFAAAAVRASRAGLPGVELQAANGYLFSQFESRVTNQRHDRWGGSIDNRMRFLLRTIGAIRKLVPESFILGVRLRAEDTPMLRGYDMDDSIAILGALQPADVSYVHLATRTFRDTSWMHPRESQTNLNRFRAGLDDRIRLMVAGKITVMADAEEALDDGADLIALGKSAIATPDWPRRAANAGFRPEALSLSKSSFARLGVTEPFADYLRLLGVAE